MYWASKRETTRKEDEAYCLLGLFGVNMPLLYGEGSKAFFRLQQEIIKTADDQSILAWYVSDQLPLQDDIWYDEQELPGGLGPSARCFALSGNIWPSSSQLIHPSEERLRNMECTEAAVAFSAISVQVPPAGQYYEYVLNCQIGTEPGTFPTIFVAPDNTRLISGHGVTSRQLYDLNDLFPSSHPRSNKPAELDLVMETHSPNLQHCSNRSMEG